MSCIFCQLGRRKPLTKTGTPNTQANPRDVTTAATTAGVARPAGATNPPTAAQAAQVAPEVRVRQARARVQEATGRDQLSGTIGGQAETKVAEIGPIGHRLRCPRSM